MKSIHFFTEIGPNLQQAVGQNFGPLNSSKFNVSSMHSWTGSNNPKAFAVFTGQIVYQKDVSSINTGLLNAILKISDPKGLNDLPLKYIVYRGILESSVLQSDHLSFLDITDENHIVRQILEQDLPSATDYLSLGLGITADTPPAVNQTFLSSDADLERLFSSSITGWEVKAGTVLGEFQTTAFGIDAIQESGWKRPQVKILREPLISEGNTVEIISPASAAEIKAEKEAILNYIDPACLYSLFYTKGIQTILHEEPRKMQQVYDDILVSFLNRNRVYLDIRNHNDFSLNFYGDNTNISFKDSSDNPQNHPYEYSNWPIHIINEVNIKKPSGEAKTEIPLALPATSNTLNTCFLVHAAAYKKELIGIVNKYPKYQNGGAKFRDLRIDVDQNDRTGFFSVSTFKDDSNNETVCSYFRMFYAKQWEESGSNALAIVANDVMDNLFIAENIETYTERLEGASMRHWLTGRMVYIPKYLADDQYSIIDYPGMYYSGVAIDEFTITFYAIPFAVHSSRKQPSGKLALPESSEAGFIETLVLGGAEDFRIEKFTVNAPPEGNVDVLNIYNGPASPEAKKFDEEAFVGLSLTRTEYINSFANQLNGFRRDLHPVFIKVDRSSYGNVGSGSKVTRQEFMLYGYNNQAEIKSENIAGKYFYSLTKKLGRFCHTAQTATTILFADVLSELQEFSGITIDHNMDGSPEEFRRYVEIAQALKLVKSFMKDQYDEIARILGKERVDLIPTFKIVGNSIQGAPAGANKVLDQLKEQTRKYSITIKYDPMINLPIAGKTEVSPLMATVIDYDNLDPSNPPPNTGGDNDIISVIGDDNINKNVYEMIAVQNIFSTPKQIEESYIPEIKTRIEDTSNPSTTKDSELIAYTDIPGAGRAIYDNNYVIKISENLRNNADFSTDELTFTTRSFDADYTEKYKGEFAGISKLLLQVATTIAHELGHVLLHITKPVLISAWGELEDKYVVNDITLPTSAGSPSFRGEGHLEGNPEGNLTARYEYFFSKALVQDGMWNYATKVINDTTGLLTIRGEQIYLLRRFLKPPYAQNILTDFVNVDGDTVFEITWEIRDYLKGNLGLSEIELPSKTTYTEL